MDGEASYFQNRDCSGGLFIALWSRDGGTKADDRRTNNATLLERRYSKTKLGFQRLRLQFLERDELERG